MYTGIYTREQMELIETNGLEFNEVDAQWQLFPDQELETVIGSVKILKQGNGQERNEPFSGEATGGVMGE